MKTTHILPFAIIAALLLIFSGSIAMAADQAARSHPGCTGGGNEAEKLFNLGRDYSKGIHSMPFDKEKAVKFYKESIELGNPKAAINLGIFLRMMSVDEPNEQEMTELSISYYQKAIDMGCPDAYYYLADSYQHGWGVPRSERKGRQLIEKGAEEGSFACMAGVGMILDHDGKPEEAKMWLQRSLDGGYGPAAGHLRRIYFGEGNLEKEIQTMRQGARFGDYSSLIGLNMLYEDGRKQPKDLEYAACFINIAREIDTDIAPPMIDDLDKRCPPRPVIPYTRSEAKQK